MRRLCLFLTLLALVLAAAVPAGAQDGVHVAAGVKVGDVDLSGLTTDEARVRLEQQFRPQLASKVTVQAGSKRFLIAASKARLAFDSSATAMRAFAAAPGSTVAPSITVNSKAITAWVAIVAKTVYVAPRSAKLVIRLKRLTPRKAKPGKRISNASVVAAVTKAFIDPAAPRLIAPKLRDAVPATTDSELKKEFSTVLTVSQSQFKVRLFKRFKLVKTFPIAVGSPAHPTPRGRFKILDKAVNPVWSVPNSPWAGELQGTTVQGGTAQNPLKARWMGIGDGIGFHGTGEDYSIGSRASHGCMRMHVKDVIALYPRVPVGATVLIK